MSAGVLAYAAGLLTVPAIWVVWLARRWLVVNVLRRSPLGLTVMKLGTAVPRLRDRGWDIKLAGVTGRRFGIGFVYATPPVFECDTCDQQFKTDGECIAHEKALRHGDYRYEEAR